MPMIPAQPSPNSRVQKDMEAVAALERDAQLMLRVQPICSLAIDRGQRHPAGAPVRRRVAHIAVLQPDGRRVVDHAIT